MTPAERWGKELADRLVRRVADQPPRSRAAVAAVVEFELPASTEPLPHVVLSLGGTVASGDDPPTMRAKITDELWRTAR